MTVSFSLGLEQVRNELVFMSSRGCYWVTASRQEDAQLLMRQAIAAQSALTLISCPEKPHDLLPPAPQSGPGHIPLFSLPETPEALINLTADLSRALADTPRLLLFYNAFSCWEKLNSDQLNHWLKEMQTWLADKKSTLLIITWGDGVNVLHNALKARYRHLEGLSHLTRQQDSWSYRINWWRHENGIVADRTLRLSLQQDRLSLVSETTPGTPLMHDDESVYLAEGNVLNGAVPPSGAWTFFDDNSQLALRAQHASAATVIFNLSNNEQIAGLAGDIHHLRHTRGSALKIVVREMQTALRYSDERLLLACGVNVIVPYTTPMSRFIALLEGLQDQRYNRHIPADISVLLKSLQPPQEKGYLPADSFCRAVTALLNNAGLPHNGKGLLVALRPVPELSAQQLLTLCKPRRFGDLATCTEDRWYLFLSSCRDSDLETALKYIFRRPPEEMFTHRMVWCEDAPVLSEVRNIADGVPTPWSATSGI